MRHLPPIPLKEKYYVPIEREINRILYEFIYKPLAAIILPGKKLREVRNDTSALREAVTAGTVWYQDGAFHGSYNSRISKEIRAIGGEFHPLSHTWTVDPGNVPPDVRVAQVHADARLTAARRQMIGVLDSIDTDEIADLASTPEHYNKTVGEMNKDFVKAADAISIIPRLTDQQRAIISREWGTNLNLYIKNWADKNILELREKVQANAFAGNRSKELVSMLQENYGVSKRKAKFLARQETSLLLSTFHKTRYAEIGVRKYKWSTSHDERVRHDHAVLNGKIFNFDQPPITNRKTGARNNPGMDFNCRCVAIPVVE